MPLRLDRLEGSRAMLPTFGLVYLAKITRRDSPRVSLEYLPEVYRIHGSVLL